MRKLPDKKQLRKRKDLADNLVRAHCNRAEVKDHHITSVRNRNKYTHVTCFLPSTLLSYAIRDPCLGNGATYSGLSSWSVNSPVSPPQTNLIKAIIQVQFSSRGFLIRGKLTFKTNHHKRPSVERKQPGTAGYTEHLQCPEDTENTVHGMERRLEKWEGVRLWRNSNDEDLGLIFIHGFQVLEGWSQEYYDSAVQQKTILDGKW